MFNLFKRKPKVVVEYYKIKKPKKDEILVFRFAEDVTNDIANTLMKEIRTQDKKNKKHLILPKEFIDIEPITKLEYQKRVKKK